MTTGCHSFWRWRYRSEAEGRIYLLALNWGTDSGGSSFGPAANDEQEGTVR